MIITATIKRHSPVWNLWRGHHRVSGAIAGVPFFWTVGDNYGTDVTGLRPEQVEALRHHPSVQMDMRGAVETLMQHLPDPPAAIVEKPLVVAGPVAPAPVANTDDDEDLNPGAIMRRMRRGGRGAH